MMHPPSYMEQHMELSPTVFIENNNTKDNFRFSVASTSTNTTTTSSSTQRLSIVSLSEEDNTVVHCRTNAPFYIQRSFENNSLKNKILNKFYASPKKSLSEEGIMQNSIVIDPWCVSVRYALEYAICSDWMYKYETPVLSFTKSWKKRFFVLMDRIVYDFKTQKPTSPAREHFTLSEDTFVFVTEEFKKGYVIELRKPKSKWNIKCCSIDQLKTWLDSMKKIVACIKVGYDGLLSSSLLSLMTLTDDYRILLSSVQGTRTLNRSSLNAETLLPSTKKQNNLRSSQRLSLSEIPDWETLIPPQLPPPRTRPPPVPLPTVSE